jgi:hypothetical protein
MIMRITRIFTCLSLLCFAATALSATSEEGLVARWTFEEDSGEIVKDVSGNGRDGKLSGAIRTKDGDGYALSLDGFDDHVDFSDNAALGVGGALSVETWIKPMREAHGEAVLMGEGFDNSPMPGTSALLTYYNGENVYWYIGNGGNGIRAPLKFRQWNHVVATFDGKHMWLWINGRKAADRESKFTKVTPRGVFRVGASGSSLAEKFLGLLDDVRVYNRALSADEIAAHFQAKMNVYCDLTWTKRVKATLYPYPQRNEVLVEADYNGLEPPLGSKARLDVSVSNKTKPEEVFVSRSLEAVPARAGLANVVIPCSDLPAGDYLVRIKMTNDDAALPG